VRKDVWLTKIVLRSGGIGWTGPTVCAPGAGMCHHSNVWYSQVSLQPIEKKQPFMLTSLVLLKSIFPPSSFGACKTECISLLRVSGCDMTFSSKIPKRDIGAEWKIF